MSNKNSYPLLETIETPRQLRKIPTTDLPLLAAELRRFLIHSVAKTGGHLSAGLGTVELTIALHYVYNTPEDRLIWDVGHQSYPHKILTGRRKLMSTLRQQKGLSGFPKRTESPYDSFGTGHSSTSISAALGMAIAARREGSSRQVAAIIGDGAMTGGMAFEALNHAGHLKSSLLVILNDNEMSISPNVGGMHNYLAKILSGKFYSTVRDGSKNVLSIVPPVWELARKAEEHMKGMVVPGTLFEELGFNYIGPIDGHDLPTLITTLKNLRDRDEPRFLHIVTRKGKGFPPAEKNPTCYHGVTSFNPETGEIYPQPTPESYTELFGKWICDMAEQDERLIGITPAMCEGSGLGEFSRRFPQRYFDVGIAEQHAVTLAAGMACDGLKPVVAIYSSFLQRAYDQLIHDVALQNLPVLFAIDRAGLVGSDGPTHAGSFDLGYLRCIPNLVIMAPADGSELRRMLYTGFLHDGPVAVRYPRGSGLDITTEREMKELVIGKGQVFREGHRVALIAFGSMVAPALQAAEELDATVVNMRFVKPLDAPLLIDMARHHDFLVTIEENAISGGAGSAVNECLHKYGAETPVINLGLPDNFVEHGKHEELLAQCGLDAKGIAKTVRKCLD